MAFFNACGRNCEQRNFIPLCYIHAALNRLYCSLCSNYRYKRDKIACFSEIVRCLSRFSVSPDSGYAAFVGAQSNDPSKFLATYIDNLRGPFDPNLNVNTVYHITFVAYGDTNNICRTLIQRHDVISGNSMELTGRALSDGMVSQKVFRSQPNTVLPAGLTMPPALGYGSRPVGVIGAPEEILNEGEGPNIFI